MKIELHGYEEDLVSLGMQYFSKGSGDVKAYKPQVQGFPDRGAVRSAEIAQEIVIIDLHSDE